MRILERVAISFSRGLPNLVIELMPLASPTLAGGFFTTAPPGKPVYTLLYIKQITDKDLLYITGNILDIM